MIQADHTEAFFTLLRAGLWNGSADNGRLFNPATDWNVLLTLAEQQTVSGLVADAIFRLPPEQQPATDTLRKLTAQVAAITRRHALLNNRLVEVVGLLQAEGIHSVLLKGQGVATLYPHPTLRMCGDIDLYIGKENYARACQLLRERNGEETPYTESEKHFHTTFGGVTVELHRIAEKLFNPLQDARFQRWSTNHLQENKTDIVHIEGEEIQVPSVCVNAVYVFNHLWHHFIAGGIGLRQFCDWVMVLHRFHEKSDLVELKACLKAFGLWRAWRIFGCIAVTELGLPEAEFPFFDARLRPQADKVLARILSEGNFGKYSKAQSRRPDGIIAGKLHSLRHISSRIIGIATVSPLKAAEYYVRFLVLGLKGLIQALTGMGFHYSETEKKTGQ